MELKGHTAWVKFAVYTPDGKKIITAGMDDTARIWSAETGEELKKLEVRDGLLRASAFTPDRTKVAVTGSVARLLNSELGEELQVVQLSWLVDGASISPDGKKIVTTVSPLFDGPLFALLLDADTGRTSHRLVVRGISVFYGAFSPDSAKIVTRVNDNTAIIWDTESGNVLHTLTGHTEFINTVSFSPDGTKVVTTSCGLTEETRRYVGTVYIWDVESGKELHKLPELLGGVRDTVFSPDGKRIVTVNGTNGWAPSDARIWDVESGKELKTLALARDFIVFSPDGKQIVTGGEGHTAVIWDAESGRELQRLQGNPDSRASVGLYLISLASYDPKVSSVTFSPDGKKVVTASNDGSVRIWTLE